MHLRFLFLLLLCSVGLASIAYVVEATYGSFFVSVGISLLVIGTLAHLMFGEEDQELNLRESPAFMVLAAVVGFFSSGLCLMLDFVVRIAFWLTDESVRTFEFQFLRAGGMAILGFVLFAAVFASTLYLNPESPEGPASLEDEESFGEWHA